MNIKNDPETYKIIGAAMAVHQYFGDGFLESVYQDALDIEMTQRGIPHLREVPIPIYYREQKIQSSYRADFPCYGTIVVEFKALAALSGKEDSQILNYLKATRLHRGLLLNFGARSLQHKRFVFGEADSNLC